MIAIDTSVVVAGFATWHEGHRAAAAVLGRRPRIDRRARPVYEWLGVRFEVVAELTIQGNAR